jgi:hypothetical protein
LFSSVKRSVPGESYGSTLDQINRRRRIWAVCGALALDVLRDMKSLKTIGIGYDQQWSAAEFWARYAKGEFTK